MWREELLHPFLAHLPIVLIPLALGLRAASSALRKSRQWDFLAPASRLVLVLAALAAWTALLSGGLAEDVVNKTICDPTVTQEHESFADWTTYLVTLAAVTDLAQLKLIGARWRWLSYASVLALLASMGLIAKTGHLGASLVYQQGAGVYHPTPECKEFE